MAIKVKEEFENEHIAFGRGANARLPLGQRSDIHKIARLALQRNKDLMKYFEDGLTIEDVESADEYEFLKSERRNFNMDAGEKEKNIGDEETSSSQR